MPRAGVRILLDVLILVLTLALAPLPTPCLDDEGTADELLAAAEELARRGKYDKAVDAYTALAESYPLTESGGIAARRSQPSAFLGWAELVRHGPSDNRVDIVLMGDGYELKKQKEFDKLAARIPDYFERQETFGAYYGYLNFLRANLVSADSGMDGFGKEYDTALNASLMMTHAGNVVVDHSLVHRMLDELPEHDRQAVVFVKKGTLGTGGGGVAVIGGGNVKTMFHELGHSFGGLSDEYTTETHARGATRDGINVSTTADLEAVPWRHFIEAEVEGVAAYEGANGQAKDAWRPTTKGCAMDSSSDYCVVCREAIVLRIYSMVDPIDGCEPPPHEVSKLDELALGGGLTLSVDVLQPATHDLEVCWWIVSEDIVPRGSGFSSSSSGRYATKPSRRSVDRRRRGPLHNISTDPRVPWQPVAGGRSTLSLARDAFAAPGRWRVVCRVRDTTRLKGSEHPWVIRDDDDLLTSERAWWVRVD